MNHTSTQKFLLGIAVLIFVAAPAFGQKQTPPLGGAPKAFTLPAHETYSLANGMKVTLVPYGTLPKVTASLVVRGGSVNQTPEQYSVASILGNLLKEGTSTRSAKQLAEEFAQMGGDLGAGIGEDESAFTTDVLSEFGPNAVRLLADVALHPLLPESELARLKNDALRQVLGHLLTDFRKCMTKLSSSRKFDSFLCFFPSRVIVILNTPMHIFCTSVSGFH